MACPEQKPAPEVLEGVEGMPSSSSSVKPQCFASPRSISSMIDLKLRALELPL
jgi:hypothetical protein